MTTFDAGPMRSLSPALAVALLACTIAGCRPPEPDTAAPPASAAGGEGELADYLVRIDPNEPLRLQGELNLRPGTGRTAQVRGINFGLASQVRTPRCDGEPLTGESPDGPWALPDDCTKLAWDIEVATAPATGLDASRQLTTYFPEGAWWLLSEPSSLLRVTGTAEDAPRSLRITSADDVATVAGRRAPGSDAHLHVPQLSSPPEFHVIGSPASQRHALGPLTVDYVLDDPARTADIPLADAHLPMLRFLLQALEAPDTLPEADARLLVVWLGIDASAGEAGGAAGGRSFLANYIDGDPDERELNIARTLMILAHEQFHQLHDLLGSGPPLPTWFGESLAQYYALRALQHSGLPDEIVQRAVSHFIDAERPVQHGLRTLQAMHEQGDPEAYGEFYYQGATFWSEVDSVLRETGLPDHGLDAVVPEVIRTGGAGVDLPPELRRQLLESGGPAMEAVLDRYL